MRMSASLISISTSSRLGQHGDGGGGGVDAALRLGLAARAARGGRRSRTSAGRRRRRPDRGDDLLVAAHLAFATRSPPRPSSRAVCGVALVHAEEVAGEQRRLVAAGAGAHLEDRRGVLVGVARRQQQGQLALQSAARSRPARPARRGRARPSRRRRRRPAPPARRAGAAARPARSAASATGFSSACSLASRTSSVPSLAALMRASTSWKRASTCSSLALGRRMGASATPFAEIKGALL